MLIFFPARYADFMHGLVSGPVPDFKYHIVSVTTNETDVCFFATFTGTHSGPGGPVEPATPHKVLSGTYVYLVTFNGEGKVAKMTKCFDIFTAFNNGGWPLPK